MVKVRLKWCIAPFHSGHPWEYDVGEETTLGEICKKVIDTNQEWFDNDWVQHRFKEVKICNCDEFYDNSMCVGELSDYGECYLVFAADVV